jgi:hypothetical protein
MYNNMVRKNAKNTTCVSENTNANAATTTATNDLITTAALTTAALNNDPIIDTIAPKTTKVKKIIKTKKMVETASSSVLASETVPEVTATTTATTSDAASPATTSATASPALEVVKAKRGRKSKKDLLASLSNASAQPSVQLHINELDSANVTNNKIL